MNFPVSLDLKHFLDGEGHTQPHHLYSYHLVVVEVDCEHIGEGDFHEHFPSQVLFQIPYHHLSHFHDEVTPMVVAGESCDVRVQNDDEMRKKKKKEEEGGGHTRFSDHIHYQIQSDKMSYEPEVRGGNHHDWKENEREKSQKQTISKKKEQGVAVVMTNHGHGGNLTDGDDQKADQPLHSQPMLVSGRTEVIDWNLPARGFHPQVSLGLARKAHGWNVDDVQKSVSDHFCCGKEVVVGTYQYVYLVVYCV